MAKLNEFYYCNSCRKIIENVADLLFVEDTNNRGFCSQECIESFYAPVVEFFQQREEELRSKYGALDEISLDLLNDENNIEQIINNPDESFVMKNQLGDVYTTFIKEVENAHGNKAYIAALLSLYNEKPSFVYFVTATENRLLLDELIPGGQKTESTVEELLEKGEEGFGSMVVDDTFIEMIEAKKSKLLAQLLMDRSDEDIAIEEFTEYDHFVGKTMEAPDEIYMEVDDEGDKIYKYIKAYAEKGQSFIHFVFCTPYEKATKESSQDESMEALLPIIAFPSNQASFIKSMKSGKQISGNLKN